MRGPGGPGGPGGPEDPATTRTRPMRPVSPGPRGADQTMIARSPLADAPTQMHGRRADHGGPPGGRPGRPHRAADTARHGRRRRRLPGRRRRYPARHTAAARRATPSPEPYRRTPGYAASTRAAATVSPPPQAAGYGRPYGQQPYGGQPPDCRRPPGTRPASAVRHGPPRRLAGRLAALSPRPPAARVYGSRCVGRLAIAPTLEPLDRTTSNGLPRADAGGVIHAASCQPKRAGSVAVWASRSSSSGISNTPSTASTGSARGPHRARRRAPRCSAPAPRTPRSCPRGTATSARPADSLNSYTNGAAAARPAA